jgi:triosephosphate isomerase
LSARRIRCLFATLKNRIDTVDLTLAVRGLVRPSDNHVIGICVSAAALSWASACRRSLAAAAQNCGWPASYALTGETSIADLQLFGVEHCIVGHSEPKLHLQVSEETIQRRLSALLAAVTTPILCFGETRAAPKAYDSEARRRAAEVAAGRLRNEQGRTPSAAVHCGL